MKKTLKDFYGPFTKAIKSKNKIEKITNMGDAPKEFPCPICGGPMVYKLSKNGRFMSCANPRMSRRAQGRRIEIARRKISARRALNARTANSYCAKDGSANSSHARIIRMQIRAERPRGRSTDENRCRLPCL